MARSDNQGNQEVAPRGASVPTSVPIGPSAVLDLSFLDEKERAVLLKDYARGVLDIAKTAQQLHVDIGALKATLITLSDTTRDITDAGNSVTISHTQTTNIGRTEIMMGNTDVAQRGKLNRTQTGEKDWTPYYIIGALIAVVLIAALMAH